MKFLRAEESLTCITITKNGKACASSLCRNHESDTPHEKYRVPETSRTGGVPKSLLTPCKFRVEFLICRG